MWGRPELNWQLGAVPGYAQPKSAKPRQLRENTRSLFYATGYQGGSLPSMIIRQQLTV